MTSAQNDPAEFFRPKFHRTYREARGLSKGRRPATHRPVGPPPVSDYLARLPEESLFDPAVNILTIYGEVRHWPTVGTSLTSPRGADRPLTIRMDSKNPSANCS